MQLNPEFIASFYVISTMLYNVMKYLKGHFMLIEFES